MRPAVQPKKTRAAPKPLEPSRSNFLLAQNRKPLAWWLLLALPNRHLCQFFALTFWALSILTVLRVESGCQSVDQSREKTECFMGRLSRRAAARVVKSAFLICSPPHGTWNLRDVVLWTLQPDALNGGLVLLWERVESFFPAVASDF
jgi:hypothetical protein